MTHLALTLVKVNHLYFSYIFLSKHLILISPSQGDRFKVKYFAQIRIVILDTKISKEFLTPFSWVHKSLLG